MSSLNFGNIGEHLPTYPPNVQGELRIILQTKDVFLICYKHLEEFRKLVNEQNRLITKEFVQEQLQIGEDEIAELKIEFQDAESKLSSRLRHNELLADHLSKLGYGSLESGASVRHLALVRSPQTRKNMLAQRHGHSATAYDTMDASRTGTNMIDNIALAISEIHQEVRTKVRPLLDYYRDLFYLQLHFSLILGQVCNYCMPLVTENIGIIDRIFFWSERPEFDLVRKAGDISDRLKEIYTRAQTILGVLTESVRFLQSKVELQKSLETRFHERLDEQQKTKDKILREVHSTKQNMDMLEEENDRLVGCLVKIDPNFVDSNQFLELAEGGGTNMNKLRAQMQQNRAQKGSVPDKNTQNNAQFMQVNSNTNNVAIDDCQDKVMPILGKLKKKSSHPNLLNTKQGGDQQKIKFTAQDSPHMQANSDDSCELNNNKAQSSISSENSVIANHNESPHDISMSSAKERIQGQKTKNAEHKKKPKHSKSRGKSPLKDKIAEFKLHDDDDDVILDNREYRTKKHESKRKKYHGRHKEPADRHKTPTGSFERIEESEFQLRPSDGKKSSRHERREGKRARSHSRHAHKFVNESPSYRDRTPLNGTFHGYHGDIRSRRPSGGKHVRSTSSPTRHEHLLNDKGSKVRDRRSREPKGHSGIDALSKHKIRKRVQSCSSLLTLDHQQSETSDADSTEKFVKQMHKKRAKSKFREKTRMFLGGMLDKKSSRQSAPTDESLANNQFEVGGAKTDTLSSNFSTVSSRDQSPLLLPFDALGPSQINTYDGEKTRRSSKNKKTTSRRKLSKSKNSSYNIDYQLPELSKENLHLDNVSTFGQNWFKSPSSNPNSTNSISEHSSTGSQNLSDYLVGVGPNFGDGMLKNKNSALSSNGPRSLAMRSSNESH